MPDQGDPEALDPEDGKIVTLARSEPARTGAAERAVVRDTDARTHAAAGVALPSLTLSALQAAVVTTSSAFRDLPPTAHIPRADPFGAVVETLTPETP